MRRALNLLYDGAAGFAALLMVGVLAAVLTSVLGRLLGWHVQGTDAYAGYAMAGAGFLAMAHTLKRGEHIRVTLVVGKLAGTRRRLLEQWALSVALLISGLLAYFSVRHCLQSFEFNDMSTSNDATPLWIPQMTMAAGSLILCIAFLDEWVLGLCGKRANGQTEEMHYE